MFALPSDYVAAQDAGKAFVADYYGRLNTSAESVVAMFTQSSRYYSMDSLNGRPAVGLADIFREVRRFLGTYSGGRRFASVVSVDAQIDGTDGGQTTRNFGRYDSDDTDNDDLNDHGAPYLAVFVRAEWTDTRRSLVPLPFVQTFRVRWLTATVRGHRFKVDITVVKTMVATVQPLLHEHQLQRRHRRLDATQRGFSNSEREENRYNTSTTRQFKQETYAGYTKHLNAEAREFELLSDTMLPPHLAAQSTDDELEPSDGGPYLNDVDENESIREQYITYRNKVKAFLEEPMTDYLPSTGTANTTDDDDDDDRPTNLLRVDRLDKSITADQLYAAFNRYGKVQWVRVFPGGNNWPSGSVYPYHSARVCFERTESVDKAMADYQEPGCTINGGLVTFSKSKPGQ